MFEWLERIVGAENVPMAFWALVGCASLVVLYLLFMLIRKLRSGTYVAGGRNRKARLAVMDATAIDAHRRLVLVRRDDVEHLILIGGHTDIVVESDIRLHGSAKRPTMISDATHAEEQQSPAAIAVQLARTEPTAPAAPAPQPLPAPKREVVAPPMRPMHAPQAQAAKLQQRPAVTPPPARAAEDLDSDLLKELETALDTDEAVQQAPKRKPSLDEEMAKLLGELSSHKR